MHISFIALQLVLFLVSWLFCVSGGSLLTKCIFNELYTSRNLKTRTDLFWATTQKSVSSQITACEESSTGTGVD